MKKFILSLAVVLMATPVFACNTPKRPTRTRCVRLRQVRSYHGLNRNMNRNMNRNTNRNTNSNTNRNTNRNWNQNINEIYNSIQNSINNKVSAVGGSANVFVDASGSGSGISGGWYVDAFRPYYQGHTWDPILFPLDPNEVAPQIDPMYPETQQVVMDVVSGVRVVVAY